MRFLIKDLIMISILFLFKLGFRLTLLFTKTTISSIEKKVFFFKNYFTICKTTGSNFFDELISIIFKKVENSIVYDFLISLKL